MNRKSAFDMIRYQYLFLIRVCKNVLFINISLRMISSFKDIYFVSVEGKTWEL